MTWLAKFGQPWLLNRSGTRMNGLGLVGPCHAVALPGRIKDLEEAEQKLWEDKAALENRPRTLQWGISWGGQFTTDA